MVSLVTSDGVLTLNSRLGFIVILVESWDSGADDDYKNPYIDKNVDWQN